MACVKRQETGCCSHTQCPFAWLKDLECVEVRWAEGRGFCEIGLDCVQACEFSYTYDLEEAANIAFGVVQVVGKCENCGSDVKIKCCDAATVDWDFWAYCSNAECKKNVGEGVFQESPSFVIEQDHLEVEVFKVQELDPKRRIAIHLGFLDPKQISPNE